MTADPAEARREHARLLARDCTRGVQHYAYNAADCPACSAALEAWDAHGGTPTPTAAATPSTPMPTVAATPSPVQRASTPAAPAVPTTPEALLNAINAAPDDTARARVLAAAPRELRAQLKAMLAHRELMTTPTALDVFARQLDAAADDAARLAIIAGTDRAVLAEWRFWRRANDDTAPRHYLALANQGRETGSEY